MKQKIRKAVLSLTAAVTIAGSAFCMTACGDTGNIFFQNKSDNVTLLKTENVIVKRSGNDTEVLDVKGNKKYTYTLKRVRKGTGEGHRANCTESEYIKVISAGKVIVIEDKGTGETYYF